MEIKISLNDIFISIYIIIQGMKRAASSVSLRLCKPLWNLPL